MTPSPKKVARRFLADLSPPLGYPGGACHVIKRIRKEVTNPGLANILIDDVEDGEDLDNSEAARVYDMHVEAGPAKTKFKHLLIGPHAQYRMDLRGVTVPEVRFVLVGFNKAFLDDKSRNGVYFRKWSEMIMRAEPINYTDKRLGLTLVFKIERDGTAAKIVTAYWAGQENPPGINEAQCH